MYTLSNLWLVFVIAEVCVVSIFVGLASSKASIKFWFSNRNYSPLQSRLFQSLSLVLLKSPANIVGC